MRLGRRTSHFDHIVLVRKSYSPQNTSFTSPNSACALHCLVGTPGHAFHPSVYVPENAIIVETGQDPSDPGHDAFHQTGLGERLLELDVTRVVVAGLATEHAVTATALGSLRESFETWVLVDAIAAIDPSLSSAGKAILEMRHAGVELASAGQIATILRYQPRSSCLVLTGFQVDFSPGGSVPVEGATEVYQAVSPFLQAHAPH